ncbi:MAG TPA: LysR family transcriptional regulator [Gammaproteobacteria bacterium]|nr:LysR family transcriptional regulator [Gammaproteobacteria bacterium]
MCDNIHTNNKEGISNMNWDDIRIFVSVSKEKSFSLTAKKQKTTQATISRRIQNFEQQIGHKLFDRGQEGCVLTPQGKSLLKYANEMHSWANAFEEKAKSINNQDRDVIITCGNMIGRYLSANLSQLYDNIDDSNIEIRATPKQLDLEKHEADISLRNTRPKSGQLKIRKLDVSNLLDFYVYGNKKRYCEKEKINIDEFDQFSWVSYTKDMADLFSAKWLNDHIDEKNIKYRLSCSSLLIETLKNSDALTILPQFVGESSEHLIKVHGPISSLKSSLWLVRRNDQSDKLIHDIANNIETIFKSRL